MKPPPKKILIIRYRFIGDTVISTAFIKNVKMLFPDSIIDILVSPGSGELVENNPQINNVFYISTTKFHKYEKSITEEKTKSFYSLFSCAQKLKKEKYDYIFVLKRSFSSALLAFLIGGRERLGFNTEYRSFLLTHSIPYKINIRESENFNNLLEKFNKENKKLTENPEIFLTQAEEIKAAEYINKLDSNKLKILIHATSAHPYKQWPNRYFSEVIDALYEKYKAQIIFTGAENDLETYEKILKQTKNKEKIKKINLCGKISLRECFSVYKNIHVALCVDSGNAHMAAAAGVHTFVLYGPTRKERWLPQGTKKNIVKALEITQKLPCQPCDVKVFCTHINCMKLLRPEYVVDEVCAFINEKLNLS